MYAQIIYVTLSFLFSTLLIGAIAFFRKPLLEMGHGLLLKFLCLAALFKMITPFSLELFSPGILNFHNVFIPSMQSPDVIQQTGDVLIIVMLVLAAIGITRIYSVVHEHNETMRIIKSSREVERRIIGDALCAAKMDAAWASKVTFYHSDLFIIPFCTGVIHPVIVLPSKYLTLPILPFIVKHEVSHILHKDHLFLFGASVLKAFFWWFPPAHSLSNSLRYACEFHADDRVVRDLAPEEAHAYAQILIDVYASTRLESQNGQHFLRRFAYASDFLPSGHFSKKRVQRREYSAFSDRLANIAAKRTRPRHIASLCIGAFVVAIFALLVTIVPTFTFAPIYITPENSTIVYHEDNTATVIMDDGNVLILEMSEE